MSPYIVTTKRPTYYPPGPGIIGEPGPEKVSRRAVATLEGREVWNALYGVDVPNREDVVEQIAALPESGGVVGPLPDGTVIEVKAAAGACSDCPHQRCGACPCICSPGEHDKPCSVLNKHDGNCLRRKDENARLLYVCTCGLTDKQVAEVSS